MALEFVTAKTMSVKMKVDMKTDGTIAESGETVGASKYYELFGIKNGATFAEAKKVYDAIYGTIGNCQYDDNSAIRTVKEGVA